MLFVLVFTTGGMQPAHAEMWGPWSNLDDAPAILTAADKESVSRPELLAGEDSIAALPFIGLLRIYQNYLSPFANQCPMTPSCSQFSMLAIRKHGPVIGIIMTSDRLLHEADEMRIAQLVKVGSTWKRSDPVENNDFWWYRE